MRFECWGSESISLRSCLVLRQESKHTSRRLDLAVRHSRSSAIVVNGSVRAKDTLPGPLRAHANVHTSQGLQSISLSRLPPDVVWRLHIGIGTWMQIVAQGWLIYRLAIRRPCWRSINSWAAFRSSLFSLIGGVVADRAERRKISLDVAIRANGECWAPAQRLVASGSCTCGTSCASRLCLGLAQAFGGPAYQALIPSLVDREDMPNAIALNSISSTSQ